MKTIVELQSQLSKYVFSDTDSVIFSEISEVCNGIPHLHRYVETPFGKVHDLHLGNACIYENVSVPSDWAGNKYFFDGQQWTLNPDYEALKG